MAKPLRQAAPDPTDLLVFPLDREHAEQVVAAYTRRIAQYRGVPLADALTLLGETRYARLLADPIRRLGATPQPGWGRTIYPWNVVDYLVWPELRATTPVTTRS